MRFVFLTLALLGLGLTLNAWRPLSRREKGGPRWVFALFVGELAPFHFLAQAGLAAGFAAAGWAGGWAGTAAEAATGCSLLGLAVCQWRALRSRGVMETAAAAVLGTPLRLPRLRWGRLLRPYPAVPRGLEVVRNLAYGPGPAQVADRYRRRGPAGPAPALVQVHGGGWTRGSRGTQGRPLVHQLALAGWVVFDVEYGLSPRATFPDQLIDLKRALGWIRRAAAEHGVDPSFVAVTGGSAGGHLAALAALTQNDPRYQPGFEAEDTSVQACIPVYGVHDLLDGKGRPKWPYLASHVLKVPPGEDPAAWDRASPVRCAVGERPPFLIAHGGADSLVSPEESRRLAAALAAAGGPPFGHAELPGATHGFDSIHSVRSQRFVAGAAAVLAGLWERERERTRAARAPEGGTDPSAPG